MSNRAQRMIDPMAIIEKVGRETVPVRSPDVGLLTAQLIGQARLQETIEENSLTTDRMNGVMVFCTIWLTMLAVIDHDIHVKIINGLRALGFWLN